MSIYKLYGAGSGGTENGLAQADVQFDGEIVAVYGSAWADLDADGEVCQAELSFLSQNSINVNDARGSLLIVSINTTYVTAASGVGTFANAGISGLFIPVAAGERLWLHAVASAGATSNLHMYAYVRDASQTTLRRRR